MINLTWWKGSTTKSTTVEGKVETINHMVQGKVEPIHHGGMENNKVILAMDYAIDFMEAAIMRLSIIFLIAGAIMGTVSALTPQFQLSSLPWYSLTWAIVQAVALDGLFLGVLFLLRDNWKSYDAPARVWYGGIVLLLAAVAALVNCTLAYQELHPVTIVGKGITRATSVMDAMSSLGISQVDFSYTRAILIVLVTALVCTLPRKKVEASPIVVEQKEDLSTKLFEERMKDLLQETVTSEMGRLVSILQVDASTINQPELPPPSTYNRIREYMEDNPGTKNREISEALSIPESTVKSYASRVRKELQPDTDKLQTV